MREFSKFHILFGFLLISNLILYNVDRVEGSYIMRLMRQAMRAGISSFWFRLNRLRPLGRPVGPRRRRRGGNNNNNNGGDDEIVIGDSYPPGHQELILTIAALCVPNNKLSLSTQNKLLKCLNDAETGESPDFMKTFREKCVSTAANSCGVSSMEAIQDCVNDMEEVEVPDTNIQCMEEGLSQQTLIAIKSQYPVLFESSDEPSNSQTKKSKNKTDIKNKMNKPTKKKQEQDTKDKAKDTKNKTKNSKDKAKDSKEKAKTNKPKKA